MLLAPPSHALPTSRPPSSCTTVSCGGVSHRDGRLGSPLSPAASTASFRVERSGLLLTSDQTVLVQELLAWYSWRAWAPAAAGRGRQGTHERAAAAAGGAAAGRQAVPACAGIGRRRRRQQEQVCLPCLPATASRARHQMVMAFMSIDCVSAFKARGSEA